MNLTIGTLWTSFLEAVGVEASVLKIAAIGLISAVIAIVSYVVSAVMQEDRK